MLEYNSYILNIFVPVLYKNFNSNFKWNITKYIQIKLNKTQIF